MCVSQIAWSFGAVIVVLLSLVAVNMFVAVICNTFGDVLAEQAENKARPLGTREYPCVPLSTLAYP